MTAEVPEPVLAAPAALADPTVEVGRRWVTGLSLGNIGVYAAFFGPIQVLLAQQAEALAPGNKEFVFGLVTGAGAAVSLVANPLFGALSDRTTSSHGRRVPWVLAGALAGAAGLLMLAGAPAVAVMLVGWCLVQAGCNAALAALVAAVPDQVPHRQRGAVSGWVGLAQTLGSLGGVVIATATGGFKAGFVACAAFLLVTVAPYLLGSRDVPLARDRRPDFAWGAFLKSFWVDPRLHPDFGWAWLTRFLMNVGNALGTLYLLYYLQDEVGYSDPESGVLILTLLYSVFTIGTAVLTGIWSDRTGRRKVFVVWSGVTMSVATVLLALSPTWPAALVAAVVLGTGFGGYLAVDFAIMTEVLPTATDRGKDLGVINIANSLPQVLAPAIAAPVVADLGGYPALFGLAAVVGLAGAVGVVRIRAVR